MIQVSSKRHTIYMEGPPGRRGVSRLRMIDLDLLNRQNVACDRECWLGMEKFKDTEVPDIPAMPHQPADFVFPKRPLGKTMRSCQASWFKQFSFLHYNAARDIVFCHTCVSGFRQKKMKGNNAEPAFVSTLIP